MKYETIKDTKTGKERIETHTEHAERILNRLEELAREISSKITIKMVAEDAILRGEYYLTMQMTEEEEALNLVLKLDDRFERVVKKLNFIYVGRN